MLQQKDKEKKKEKAKTKNRNQKPKHISQFWIPSGAMQVSFHATYV